MEPCLVSSRLGRGFAVSVRTGLFRVAGTISGGRWRYSRKYWIPANTTRHTHAHTAAWFTFISK